MTELSASLLFSLLRTGVFLSVAVVVVFLLFRLFRVASPAVRRTACFVVLLQGWFFVQWSVEIPVLPVLDDEFTERSSQEFWKSLGSEGSLNSFVRSLSHQDPKVSNPKGLHSSVPEPFSVTASTASADTESAENMSIQSGHVSWTVWLVVLWGAGMLAISSRTLWMYVRFIRELPSELSAEPEWESEWSTLQRQSELKAFIPLYVTEQTGPMLCRFPQGYRLIVPANLWSKLSSSQRLSILRHELAHVQRRDVWKSLSVRLLALPHWFNPLVWWVVKQFDECAEWACDEAARKATPDHVSEYARALLELGVNPDPVSSLHPAARGRGLAFRVRRLLVSNNLEDSRMKKFSFVSLVLGITLFGVMRFQLVADEPEKTTAADPSVTKSDSTLSGYRIRLSPQGPPPLKFDFGLGVNSDAGVTGTIVLHDDSFSTAATSKKVKLHAATAAGIVQSRDDDSADYVIRRVRVKVNNLVPEHDLSKKADSSIPAFPGHEAVIDMAYLFKNFDEFERERKKLKAEIAGSQKEFDQLVKDARSLQERLKRQVRGRSDETDIVVQLLEREIARKKSEMELNRVYSQKKYLRMEAQMYQKIYNKITAEVAKYAKERGIKIVRRIDRTTQRKKEIEASDPREFLRLINQEVIYIESNELDITEDILKRLQPKKKSLKKKSSN